MIRSATQPWLDGIYLRIHFYARSFWIQKNYTKKKTAVDFICLLYLLSMAHTTLTFTVTPNMTLSFDDLAKTGGPCRRKGLCSDKTGERCFSPENMSETRRKQSVCFCDDECHFFGECCPDLAKNLSAIIYEVGSSTSMSVPEEEVLLKFDGDKLFQRISTSKWGCYKLNYYSQDSAYLVDKCPDNFWDEEVITKCSKRNLIPDEEYNYLLDLPVVSSMTGVPYLNSHCLACNEEMLRTSPFLPVTLTLRCSNETLTEERVHMEAFYRKGDRVWVGEDWECTLELVDAGKVFYGDKNNRDPERPGRYTRRCQVAESSCDNEDAGLASLCSSYALYVKRKQSSKKPGMDPTVYKNPHCAACKGVRMEDIECSISFLQSSVRNFVPPSFAALFEIRWDGGRPGFQSHHCPSHQVWDVIRKKCSMVGCKDGMVLMNGTCQMIKQSLHMCDSPELEHKRSSSFLADCSGNSTGIDPDCPAGGKEEDIHTIIQGYLMVVCISVSLFCLILHIAIYSTLPKLRNLPGKNLLALSWALFMAQGIALGSGFLQNRNEYEVWCCRIVAVMIHFLYLCAIFWMNVMSVDVWRTFSSSSSHRHIYGRHETAKRLHLWYAAYAWGIPLVWMVIPISIEFAPSQSSAVEFIRPNYGRTYEGFCWISNDIGNLIFFIIPTCCLLLGNAVLFAISVYRIHANQESRRYMRKRAREEEFLYSERLSRAASTDNSDAVPKTVPRKSARQSTTTTSCISVKDKSRFYLYVKLGIIMGLTWICAFIAGFTQVRELWYPFIVLNGLQGAFIFFMFDVKRKVAVMLWEKITGRKPEFASGSSGKFSSWAFFTSKRIGRRRRESSESRTKSTTDSATRRTTSSGARTSTTVLTSAGCSESQPSPLQLTTDIQEVRMEIIQGTSANGAALSPNLYEDLEPTFSFCGTRLEVGEERSKVERISDERAALNLIREEDEAAERETGAVVT